MGVPAHRTSMPVVCPLHSGVSKQTSANWPRLTCSSFDATGEKISLPWGISNCAAAAARWGSPVAGNRRSHKTLLGTLLIICWEKRKC